MPVLAPLREKEVKEDGRDQCAVGRDADCFGIFVICK